ATAAACRIQRFFKEGEPEMISQLTRTERRLALVISTAVALAGLGLAAAGRNDPLSGHGLLVLVTAIAMAFVVISGYDSPLPAEDRHTQYYDDPVKAGIVLAMIWGVVAMFVG